MKLNLLFLKRTRWKFEKKEDLLLENKSVEEIPALSREKGPISVVVVQALVYPQWVESDFEGTFLHLVPA